jgi:mechanosensitive ion channel-like protein
MKEMILHELSQMWDQLARGFAHFVPRLIVLLIVIAAGFIIAYLLKLILRAILRITRFEKLSENAGTASMLSKAALPSSSELLSGFVFWIAWIGFILLGTNELGILGLQDEIARLFLYLPRLLMAMLIVFFGLVVASFFSRAALLAAVNSGAPSPRLIGGFVRVVIVTLAVAMAFEQLGLAEQTIIAAFCILFGAIMFGLALAFGLAGQDLARRALERMFGANADRENEREPSPL